MSSLVEVSPIEAGREQSRSVSMGLAYLISRYPAVSHTFILNEIQGLRKLGFDIVTASINPADRLTQNMDEAERQEEAATFYVKQAGAWGSLRAIVSALFREPVGFFRGFLFTLQLGGSLIRFFYFMEALLIGEWMRRHNRSHLHAHFGNAASSVAMIAARTFPIKMSLTIHGPDEFYDVRKFYLKEKVETAAFVCCISSYARSQLMFLTDSSMWDKVLVSRLGVDSSKFSPRLHKSHIDGPVEIICVGRLVGAKGQRILVSALQRLLADGRNVQLRLIGDGPDRKALEAAVSEYKISGRVIFEGAVGAARVRQLLEGAEIFALPSFAEGIPVALMEAMAMEIPCVSTTITGIPELIRNEIDGLLVAPSDDVQLATALARLIDDPELRRRVGRSGRIRVQENYELQTSITRLGDIFQCRR